MSPLLEFAQSIDSPTGKENKAQTPSGPFDPENPPMPDNGVASFERFMTSFGSPARWAGH